jgi:hypothetical protein
MRNGPDVSRCGTTGFDTGVIQSPARADLSLNGTLDRSAERNLGQGCAKRTAFGDGHFAAVLELNFSLRSNADVQCKQQR